eukprot:6670575-Ditylum_brightwellii.AAC.1
MEEMRGMNPMAKPPEQQCKSKEKKSSPVTKAITPDHQNLASGTTGKNRYQVKLKTARSPVLQKNASGGGGK